MQTTPEPGEAPAEQPPLREHASRYAANLQMEREGIALYRELARAERNPERARQFEEMGAMEAHHARVWEQKLRAVGADVPPEGPMLRPRAVGLLARLFGTKAIAPMVLAMEGTAARDYRAQGDAPESMIRDEQSHARVFRELARSQEPGAIAQQERWHRGAGGGSLRAGIFGINDGLVSNFSLVMGVAGADKGNEFVVLAGVAGLLAGACSMAAGEYISMRSQRELYERQIALEKEEIELAPEAERVELAMLYQAKGISKEQATSIAGTVMANPDVALRTMALEELGMDPDELGSPWGAAISSFVMFTIGAIIPLAPFFFAGLISDLGSLFASAVLSGGALFTVGALMGVLTGKHLLYSGGRMLIIGGAAALITFGIGKLIGVNIG